MDDFGQKFIFFSVMNDNNDFVTFFFMVLFGNHRLLFWSFGISQTKTATFDFETNHENACYAVIIL